MIISKRLIIDEDSDQQIATIVQHTLCRGDGGFSGVQITPLTGAQSMKVVYDSNPDWSVTLKTLPQAALLYRLFADLNPLHADPKVAQKAGFHRPILHGLCTYGMVCRALLQACVDGESSRLHSLSGKFTAPVFPGDSLCIEVWQGAQIGTRQTLQLRCSVPARQSVVFANASATISA